MEDTREVGQRGIETATWSVVAVVSAPGVIDWWDGGVGGVSGGCPRVGEVERLEDVFVQELGVCFVELGGEGVGEECEG